MAKNQKNNGAPTTNNEVLYQMLYTKDCPNNRDAKRLMKRDRDNYTKIYHSLLANYGGETFSLEDANKVFQNTTGILFNPGSTPESILEKLVKWGIVHKAS